MALALARKYRPRNFTNLVGQEAVSKTLSLALSSSKLSHAYLFSGIRGSGKTSTARIFAKALLCESGPTNNPCENCEHCQMANEGRHIDIIEMDAASNRGIEDIKELIEHTKYKPSIGRFKIFIIDEVHMLTVQAFNALLKTLEEPPEFVKFILATTDPLKLPATILSRVQHFRFKKLPIKLVKEHLAYILHQEGIEFEESSLEIIARSGQGSVRDALTLLDQAIVFSDGKITTQSVTNMLGIVDPNTLSELIKKIINKDKDGIIEFLNEYSSFEAEMILDELTLYIQDKLLSQDPELTVLSIDRLFRVLADGKKLLQIGSSGEFVLSLTLFKMIEAMNIHSIDDMIHKLQNELTSQNVTQNRPSVTNSNTQNIEETESQNIPENNTNISPKESTQNNETPIEEPQKTEPPTEEKPAINADILFKTLQEKIYDRNYDLGEVFKNNITYISFANNTLTWESTVEQNEKKLLIENWAIIRHFVEEIFGLDTKIKNIAKKKLTNNTQLPPKDEPKLEPQENIEQTNSCIMPEGKDEASIDKEPKELLNEPMIQEFIKHLDPKKVIVKQKS